MLDIKFIRENPDKVTISAKDKGVDVNVAKIIEIDSEYRALSIKLQELFAARNAAAKERDIEKGKSLKSEIDQHEGRSVELKQELDELLYSIPNLAKDDVKVGKNDTENDVVKTVGEPKKFGFTPKDHVELGLLLEIIDVERATKVSGARFAYLKNEGALLEFALVQFAMETLVKEGFIPIVPPVLIRPEITRGLGYWEAGGNGDYYLVYDPKNDQKELQEDQRKEGEYPGYYLVGTAEHSIVPMHRDEVLSKKELPKRYVAFSTAFRREAGSYGKDTKGILRVHQFDKVEMVSFVTEEQDDAENDYLLSLEEKFFQALGIPYQVIKMCTGDLGFPVARKYDIEAFIPTQEKYREVTSTSTTTDFQARRLNIKYQDGEEKKFAHILNGTAFAIGRTLIAILENNQEEDGSIMVPEVLRKYIPGNLAKITPKK
jgi:seryl-tRNA synthetase